MHGQAGTLGGESRKKDVDVLDQQTLGVNSFFLSTTRLVQHHPAVPSLVHKSIILWQGEHLRKAYEPGPKTDSGLAA